MIEVLPQEALEAPPPETKKTADGDTIPDDGKLRLDLGCGRSKRDAFKGVDIATDIPEVDYPGVDLTKPNWPFEDNSVEMIHSSHFLEHLDGDEQITFMNECCRILRPGGVLLIIVPYGNSPRA